MYLWEDELGNTQEIPQGEGGEQGDPLMPMFFSLAEHPAFGGHPAQLIGLPRRHSDLQSREFGQCSVIGEEFGRHAQVSIHHGKT